MPWENSSVAAAVVVAAADTHPDLENGQLSSFITKSELRSVRIDPSRRAIAEGYRYVTKIRKKKSNIKKE